MSKRKSKPEYSFSKVQVMGVLDMLLGVYIIGSVLLSGPSLVNSLSLGLGSLLFIVTLIYYLLTLGFGAYLVYKGRKLLDPKANVSFMAALLNFIFSILSIVILQVIFAIVMSSVLNYVLFGSLIDELDNNETMYSRPDISPAPTYDDSDRNDDSFYEMERPEPF